VAQVVDYLLTKCRALSSNPSQLTKKDKNFIPYIENALKNSTNLKCRTVTMLGNHKKFNVT
jgi:hypothetical protein